MTYLRTTANEHGTPVDHFDCDTCGEPFSVTPAPSLAEKQDEWQHCLSRECASYDPARDADRLFDDGNVVSFEQRRNPQIIITRAQGGS